LEHRQLNEHTENEFHLILYNREKFNEEMKSKEQEFNLIQSEVQPMMCFLGFL
jgi:hypothetical protein